MIELKKTTTYKQREQGRQCNAVCQVIIVSQQQTDLHVASKMISYLNLKSSAKIS